MRLKNIVMRRAQERSRGGFADTEFFIEFVLDESDGELLTSPGESGSAASSRSGMTAEVVADLLSRKKGGLSESARAVLDRNWCRAEVFSPDRADPHMVAQWLRYLAGVVDGMPREFREMVEKRRSEP